MLWNDLNTDIVCSLSISSRGEMLEQDIFSLSNRTEHLLSLEAYQKPVQESTISLHLDYCKHTSLPVVFSPSPQTFVFSPSSLSTWQITLIPAFLPSVEALYHSLHHLSCHAYPLLLLILIWTQLLLCVLVRRKQPSLVPDPQLAKQSLEDRQRYTQVMERTRYILNKPLPALYSFPIPSSKQEWQFLLANPNT